MPRACSAATAGLAVLADDLDLIGTATALQSLGENAADLFENETIGLAEAGERTGPRAHVSDLDDTALRIGRDRP